MSLRRHRWYIIFRIAPITSIFPLFYDHMLPNALMDSFFHQSWLMSSLSNPTPNKVPKNNAPVVGKSLSFVWILVVDLNLWWVEPSSKAFLLASNILVRQRWFCTAYEVRIPIDGAMRTGILPWPPFSPSAYEDRSVIDSNATQVS